MKNCNKCWLSVLYLCIDSNTNRTGVPSTKMTQMQFFHDKPPRQVLSLFQPQDGKILVPGVMDTVAPLTEDESKLYDPIDFDADEFAKDIGTNRLLHDSKETLLQHRWRFPSLSLHGIEVSC